MALYYFKCEKNHLFCFDFSKLGYQKFLRLCSKMLRVCSECKPVNMQLIECEAPAVNKFDDDKLYVCSEGHQNRAGLFTTGMIHLTCGDQYENFSLSVVDFYEQIKSKAILCKHSGCDKLLSPVDDSELKIPGTFGIKTKVRVGDIWDKAKCPQPRESSYDKKGNFVETDFSKRNRDRLSKMRKERNNAPAGEILKKPTKKSYRDGQRKPTKKEINGG